MSIRDGLDGENKVLIADVKLTFFVGRRKGFVKKLGQNSAQELIQLNLRNIDLKIKLNFLQLISTDFN